MRLCKYFLVSLLILVLTLCSLISNAQRVKLDSGLIACFPFNGSANDESGNGNNGTVSGATLTADRFGKANSAYSFNGVNNYISLPATIKITYNFTLCFWIQTKADYTNSWYNGAFVIDRDICSPNPDWSVGMGKGGKIQFNTGTNSDVLLNSTVDVNDNSWVFIVIMRDTASQTKKIFINTALNISASWGKSPFTNNNLPVYIGASVCSPFSHTFFTGNIDDIRYYNRALNDAEIMAIYNGACCGGTPAIVKLGKDTVICKGSSLLLNAGNPLSRYKWSTGDTTQTLNVTKAGAYSVSVTGPNCPGYDTINVSLKQRPDSNLLYLNHINDQGDSAEFAVHLKSSSKLKFQWLRDFVIIPGAVDSIIRLKNISCNDGGAYSCAVTNSCGSSNYNVVKLYVTKCSRFRFALSGYLRYDNHDTTLIKSVPVYLLDTNDSIVDKTEADSSGYFVFINIVNGSYILRPEPSYRLEWGGVNPADAFIINRYYIGLYKFTDKLKQAAADVNGDSKINPIDALKVNRRYIGIINTFKINDWIFDNQNIIINGFDKTYNLKTICTGDVNGSYIPK